MPKVKICGIRREEDISYVNKYLPEYIGFVFAQSKRRVLPSQVVELKEKLDKKIKTAGIFVNEKIGTVVEIAKTCVLDVVQIHGDESPEYILELRQKLDYGVQIWKAVRVKDADSILHIKDFDADAFLLDAYAADSYGGSGKTFDWTMAVEAGKYGSVVLAGGLNTKNIREAVNIVQPHVLDVSSGVETDGFKDENKIREFICMVRNYE